MQLNYIVGDFHLILIRDVCIYLFLLHHISELQEENDCRYFTRPNYNGFHGDEEVLVS